MSTPAWISALPTGVVKTDLTADAVDGVLTYTEALQLLNDVQTAGAVTASEFSSLQTAAANLNNGLAASDYVASIFTQLVDGSPANANWTAGGPAASASPLGDLAAGSTQTHLAQLVGQWFLGTNLPDPAPPSGPTYSYSTVTAPLYGPTGAAAVNDICQGADGDCEVMTSLILLVDNHPQQLAQMIVANPNGTWGVRFYVNGNEVWETVNDQFPTQGGELVYAHDPNFANTALWTAVIEKAYAQLSATGEIGHPAGVDSFDNINANAAADVMPAMIDASSVTYFNASDPNYTADKILYIDAVASGDDVMVETGADAKDTFDASGNMELIGDHAFAVTGYDAATGDFIVRNPWGNSFTGQNWDTTFEASLSAIAGSPGRLRDRQYRPWRLDDDADLRSPPAPGERGERDRRLRQGHRQHRRRSDPLQPAGRRRRCAPAQRRGQRRHVRREGAGAGRGLGQRSREGDGQRRVGVADPAGLCL